MLNHQHKNTSILYIGKYSANHFPRFNAFKGWLRGSVVVRRSVAGELWVTIYVGKQSAIGQPTRPTQPFIHSGTIDE